MSTYGFTEGSDFTSVKSSTLVNNGAEREISDYQVSIDMAKQICMIQRSEKGRQYRQYFIDLEKAWNTPEQIFARALKMADQTIAKLKDTNKSLVEKIEADRPKNNLRRCGICKSYINSYRRLSKTYLPERIPNRAEAVIPVDERQWLPDGFWKLTKYAEAEIR